MPVGLILFLESTRIISQLCAPWTLLQNGVEEKRNKTLMGIVRSMTNFSFFSYNTFRDIIRNHYIYSQDHHKVFVNTNVKFLMKTI